VAKPIRAIAERRTPFTSTSRYFRGRVVDVLRQLTPGAWLSLAELGPQVKADWTPDDHEWLTTLLRGLAADGLIAFDAETDCVRLP
jgi:A/G-specific adenine glycosylase